MKKCPHLELSESFSLSANRSRCSRSSLLSKSFKGIGLFAIFFSSSINFTPITSASFSGAGALSFDWRLTDFRLALLLPFFTLFDLLPEGCRATKNAPNITILRAPKDKEVQQQKAGCRTNAIPRAPKTTALRERKAFHTLEQLKKTRTETIFPQDSCTSSHLRGLRSQFAPRELFSRLPSDRKLIDANIERVSQKWRELGGIRVADEFERFGVGACTGEMELDVDDHEYRVIFASIGKGLRFFP